MSSNVVQESPRTLIDREALETIRALQQPGRPDILKKIVDLYLVDTPRQIEALRTSIQTNNPAAMRRIAHSLKSASATLGAWTLAALFKGLEEKGRQLSTESADEDLSAIDEPFPRVANELGSYL